MKFTVFILSCFSTVLVSTDPLYAQNCNTIRTPVTVVKAPEVIKQTEVIVQATPTTTVTVTVPVPVLVPAYSFQFTPNPPQQPVDSGVLKELRDIKAELSALKKGQGGDLPKAVYDDGAISSGQPAQLSEQAVAIMRNRCADCHSGKGKGGVSLFTNGQFSPNVPINAILNAIETNQMPKGAEADPGKRLTDSEKAVFGLAKQ